MGQGNSPSQPTGQTHPVGQAPATANKPAPKRRRKFTTTAVILHEKNRILDGFILLLLTFAALGSAFSLGASWDRSVSVWPFYMAMHLGLLLFCLKPFFNRSYRRLLLPPGSLFAAVMIIYAVVHWLVLSKIPYATRDELYKLLSFFGAYIAWTELAATRKRWIWLLTTVLVAGSLMAWYAFIQDFKESDTVFRLSETLTWTRPEQYMDRACGTYICPNHFAHFIGMVIIIACGLIVSQSGAMLRVISLYALPLCLYTLFLSQSRSGILGVIAGVGVTWLLLGLRRSFNFFLLALVGLILLAGGGVFAAWSLDESFRNRVQQAIEMGDIRMQIWPDTISLIEAEPVLGTGPGTYRHTFPPHRELYNKPESTLRYAHNEFLHLTAEYGIVGMAIVAVMLLWVLARMLRILFKAERPRDAGLAAIFIGLIVGSMVHSVFDFNFQLFSNPHVFIMVAGAISGRLFVSGHFRAWRVRSWGMWLLALVGMGLLVLTGIWMTQTAFNAWQEYSAEAYDAKILEDGELEDAELALGSEGKNFKRYRRMVKLSPNNPQGYAKLGEAWRNLGSPPFLPAEEKAEAFGFARENYEKALSLNPYDDETMMRLALLNHESGEKEAGYKMIKEVIAMEPFEPNYHFNYGQMLKEDGQWSSALKLLEDAKEMLQLEDAGVITNFTKSIEQCQMMIRQGGGVQVPPPRLQPLPVPPFNPNVPPLNPTVPPSANVPGGNPNPSFNPPAPAPAPAPGAPDPNKPFSAAPPAAPELPDLPPLFPDAPPVAPVGSPQQPFSVSPPVAPIPRTP